MAGEWKRVPVGEVCELIVDCVNKTAPVVDEPTPYKMLRTTNIKGGRINKEDCRRVSKETFEKWTRRADVRFGDVILTREAPLGEVGYVDFTDTVFLGQRLMQYRANRAVLEPRFLLYSFLSKDLQNQFGAHEGSGSTVSHIRVGDCSKFEIPLPPLAEQKRIAEVLGALDDKIELNRRMNATLEATARALFQSWFVDFDPVRAKLDGRNPSGMDAATAALFSDSFEHEADGVVPKGWRYGSVKDAFDLIMGQSPPGDTYNEDGNGIPLYQGRTDFGFRFPTRRMFCTAPTRYAKPGDTLVSVRAPVGDINMADEECCIGRGVAAVRHKSGAISYTYHAMANLYPDFAAYEAEGTVFGSINKQNFENLRFIVPPPSIVTAYEKIAESLDEQIKTLEQQSRTLAILRDTLLPKLLSGELSVCDAEAATC